MNAYRDFWDVHPDEVPGKTGAASVMDCSDIQDVLDRLGVSLAGKRVMDVGCGTGRMASLVDFGMYQGWDVAPGMVEYCVRDRLPVVLLNSPDDLRDGAADLVLCLSVFTHLPRHERQAYLAMFGRLTAEILVDILPYEKETGGIGAWYTPPSSFERDLVAAGFENFDSYDRVSPDGELHRYYHARKQ